MARSARSTSLRRAVLLVACAGGAALAAPAPGGPAPASSASSAVTRSVEERAAAIDAAVHRLDEVVAAGKKDRGELMVDVFKTYSDAQLLDAKRGVTVEMLLDVVKNDDVPTEVRASAAQAIVEKRVSQLDPALSTDGLGLKRRRVQFSQKVLKLLVDSDTVSRTLAKSMLETLWPGRGGTKEFKECNPRDRGSCVDASRAWEKVFRQ